MHQQSITTYTFLVLSLNLACAIHRARCENRGKHRNDFDVLIFTQHWPQTVCYLWKEKSESNDCSLPKDDEWSIHGIWPTKYHTDGPNFCNTSLPFNPGALTSIKEELETKWIDVQNDINIYSFWRHEWEKHGTCAAVLDPFNSELKYFQKGLELLDIYDMKHVLGKMHILPGGSYAVQDILDAVHNILGKRGQIDCAVNEKKDKSYIFEVRICFDKQLQLIDCDGITGFPTTCDRSLNVIYPGIVPTKYQVLLV